jgi:hypothetical protein
VLRGGSNNIQDCGSNFLTYVNAACGDVTVAASNMAASYSLGRANWPTGTTQMMQLQYDAFGVSGLDSDDAFIISYDVGTELWPDNYGHNRTPVNSMCDINGANCDTTDVHAISIGYGFIWAAGCNNVHDTTNYGGSMFFCHNGITTNYQGNSLFGNRMGTDTEVKDWGAGDRVWFDMIYVR